MNMERLFLALLTDSVYSVFVYFTFTVLWCDMLQIPV